MPARESNEHPPEASSEATGLPGLKSWRSVYLLVIVIFVLWVVLLTAFSRVFS